MLEYIGEDLQHSYLQMDYAGDEESSDGWRFIKCRLKRRYQATIGLQTRAAIPNNALNLARAPI